MVWNKKRQDPTHVSSYPTYDMAYMARAMTDADRYRTKYGAPVGLDLADKMVYMQKAAADLRSEADEALQAEFSQWLQGKHPDNAAPTVYDNSKPGVTERRQFMNGAVGPRDDWKPTWWGRGQLTHLPGVRDYLRAKKLSEEQTTLDLNQLAELGPQNIEQAWAYFKTWVKGMPQSESVAVETPLNMPDLGAPRPLAGPKADHHFTAHDPYHAPYGGKGTKPTPAAPPVDVKMEEVLLPPSPPGDTSGGQEQFAQAVSAAMAAQARQFAAQSQAQADQHASVLREMQQLVERGDATRGHAQRVESELAQQRQLLQSAQQRQSELVQRQMSTELAAARSGESYRAVGRAHAPKYGNVYPVE